MTTGSRPRPRGLLVVDADALVEMFGPDDLREVDRILELVAPAQTAASLAVCPDLLEQVEVLVTGWGAPLIDGDLLDRAPRLAAVVHGGGAVRGIASDELFNRGIALSTARDANAVPVAEFTLGVLLLSLKQFWRLANSSGQLADSRRHNVSGAYGETIGLVGYGAVGRRLRSLLRSFALTVVVYDPYVSEEDASREGIRRVSLAELFEQSAVVCVLAPLHEGTRHMVTGELVSSMRCGATLVNTSRGGVLCQDELVEALRGRPDLWAVLDVTEPEPLPTGHPLASLPNVTVTPHLAGSLGRECRRLGAHVVAELQRYVNGEPMQYVIDRGEFVISANL